MDHKNHRVWEVGDTFSFSSWGHRSYFAQERELIKGGDPAAPLCSGMLPNCIAPVTLNKCDIRRFTVTRGLDIGEKISPNYVQ